ncbi:MAG: hypothetical protein DRH04_02715 [Deltaproteobacteria bacterium]|nr:MAG: hypothetical protein DRH04_02715 [Deltaproteobacteria bacterium]
MQSDMNQENIAISQVRGFMYELSKSFFLEEPDQEKIDRWREIIAPLATEAPSITLAEAARQLSLALTELDVAAIKDEYYDLFVNPFSHRLINWTASYYVNGRNFGLKLVKIRQLMAEQGLVKEEEFKEPEDSLPVLLDLMIRLIEMESELKDSMTAQQQLLHKFLLPLATHISQRLQTDGEARLYPLCSRFLETWLQLDESYFI